MDLNSLKDQVSNLSLYDIKAGVRKVQNAVMNFTEMEAMVREATNNEPWGASSTTMQEIANGTHSYQLLNEIMPMIYKRFTEKSAEEWRQIYKALQLLEFLVKNGSERVIDDARSHLSLLKMLRQFHYIDANGKDQGLNVRNRAKELAELLSDVEKIRSERKKARSNRNKFGGVEGGSGMSGGFSSGAGGRYGGFGSEEAGYGGYSGGVYGDGGGFSGGSGGGNTGFSDTQARRDRFEEYDENDEGDAPQPSRSRRREASGVKREAKKPDPPKPKEPEVDLFSFGDDEPAAAPAIAPSTSNMLSMGAAPSTSQTAAADDDDFDDFQSATPATQPAPKPAINLGSITAPSIAPISAPSQFVAPKPAAAPQSSGFDSLLSTASTNSNATPVSAASTAMTSPPIIQQAPQQTAYQAAQPNYFTSVSVAQAQPQSGRSTPGLMPGSIGANKGTSTPRSTSGGDAFSGLLAGSSFSRSSTPSQKGPSMADMAKQKASAGIWGAPSQPSSTAGSGTTPSQTTQGGSALDDLLG